MNSTKTNPNNQKTNLALHKLDNLLSQIYKETGFQGKVGKDKNKYQYISTQPKELVGGQLKQYQLQGLNWMIDLATKNLNGILADDMGLGKTIQTIAYLAYLKKQHGIKGKHLIVAPKSVLSNWLRQLAKWMPKSETIILYATENQRQQTLKKYVNSLKFDILITSYQGIVTCYDKLKKINWQTFIIDQAHKIKNDETTLSNYVRLYKTKFKLLLTGTPLSNNLHQLWSLLNFILPNFFHDSNLFHQIQQSVNQLGSNQQEKFKAQIAIAGKFHRIINPFILRRTKAEINLGLPPKTESTLFVGMTELQLRMYKNFLKYRSVYGDVGHQAGAHVQLRKICNHPYVFNDIQPKDAPRFGQHLIESCGKMKVLDKLLEKLLKEKHKILIFSQFVMILDIIEDYCRFRQYEFSRIDGDSSIQQRDHQIQNFNNQDNINIFLLSTRSGGLGINLVAADRVILYDIDWNPQNDNQAMDRAYRIGQVRPVHVFKLITQFTIEERMLEVQKYKLIWDELVIQKGALVRKKQQDILSNLQYDQIANIGKGDIFRLQLKCDDKTIDELISLGTQKDKKKNQQIKQKLIKQINEQHINPFNLNQQITQQQKNYFVQTKQSTSQSKPLPKLQLPPYYYLYDKQRIQYLLIEKRKYLKQKHQQQLKNINQQIQKQKLNAFQNWSKDDYKNFIKANLTIKKNQWREIAKIVVEKSVKEIEKYSKIFFQRGSQYPQINKDIKKIEQAQKKIQYDQKIMILEKWRLQKKKKIFYLFKKNKIDIMNSTSIQYNCLQILNTKKENSLENLKQNILDNPIYHISFAYWSSNQKFFTNQIKKTWDLFYTLLENEKQNKIEQKQVQQKNIKQRIQKLKKKYLNKNTNKSEENKQEKKQEKQIIQKDNSQEDSKETKKTQKTNIKKLLPKKIKDKKKKVETVESR